MKRDFLISIDLPEWARWYAVDADGDIYVFEHMPTMIDRGSVHQWSGWNNNTGNAIKILTIYDMTGIDWTQTLHEIERAA